MKTPLTERLKLELPLIQAPMAGVSTPELAAAVSNAGALGSVAIGALSAENASAALRKTRQLTQGPILANVFVHDPPGRDREQERRFLAGLADLFDEAGGEPPRELEEIYCSFNEDDALVDVVLEARPAALSFHFGPGSTKRIHALKNAGIVLLATATTPEEASVLEESGIDMVVVQHADAGGHSGAFLAGSPPAGDLADLVGVTCSAVSVPVVAAGGLMNGADIRRVMEAGACGAQLGTAFIACPETSASDSYRRWLHSDAGTRVTDRISGRPARGLINPLMHAMDGVPEPFPDYPLTYDAVKQLIAAMGDSAFSVMWAGTGAGRGRALPAAELVATLADELGLRV